MTARRAVELGALLLGLAVWSYVGWDGALWDARFQLALHLIAAIAVIGLAVVALRGGELPRTRIDLPILLLVAAFGLASLDAWNAGLSARAMGAIVATVAMLPVALMALRHRPGWTALVVTIPIVALSAGALGVLAGRRIEWLLVGGPGLPPVRLGYEGTPFGSVAVPPFVILAALPLAMLAPPALRRWVVLGLLVVGVPLTLVSGSRSAWIAIAVAVAILSVPYALRRLGRPAWPPRLTPSRVGIGFLALVGGALALAFIAPRLTDVSSLLYRGNLWTDTLAAWRTDPLLGIGPGSMPWARQAAAAPFSFPVRQPHSHDVPLGILGDAGIIGILAAGVLAVTFVVVAGPWRQRTAPGRAAFAVLGGLATGSLFEDLTFLPNFNLLVVLLAAIALSGAGAVRWSAVRQPLAGVLPLGVGAVALLVVMTLGDAAAIAYRNGIDAAAAGRWSAATGSLERAVELDPWHPAGPKSLAVTADFAGRPALARVAAERSVELSPGDGLAWTNLALLCRAAEDRSCARRAADRAGETASILGRELVNVALVYEWLGEREAADAAYRRSLLTNRWTGLTVPWPRRIDVGTEGIAELGAETAELNLLIARRTQELPIQPERYQTATGRLLAHAVVGDRQAAEGAAEDAIRAGRASFTTWELVALVRQHFGLDVEHELAVGRVARGQPLAEGPSRAPLATFDIATFRGYPADGLVSGAEQLLPEVPWPWVLEPYLPPAEPAALAGPPASASTPRAINR